MLADPFNHPAGYSPSSKVGDRWRWSLTYTPFLEREREREIFGICLEVIFRFVYEYNEFQTLSLYVRNLKIHEASKNDSTSFLLEIIHLWKKRLELQFR